MSIRPLEDLAKCLQNALTSMQIESQSFGNSQEIIKTVNEVKKVFEGFVSASAPKDRAYAAALKFLREKPLTENEYDFIAAEINTPIKEQKNEKIIESIRFASLLKYYTTQIAKNEMWNLTWYWLFLSYFSLELDKTSNEILEKNTALLREFLAKTYVHFTQGKDFLPEWARVLTNHSNLLTLKPCERYAEAYLQDRQEEVNEIKNSLSIPANSWFWHQLTLAMVRYATNQKKDANFKAQIPKLINFLEKFSGYKDEAIKLILTRYYSCSDKSVQNQLRDYVIRSDIWKNPKLRNSGIASKWHHVNEDIWRMVMNWVTHENLRMFFDIISGRHGARKDRFNFWLQYIKQIEFTKLVFGEETNLQRRINPEIKKLFAEEEGVYALLDSNQRELDAFIMKIADYIFVEFSMNSNAAFVYESNNIPFRLFDKRMNDNTVGNGLKSAQHNKIIHNNDWQIATKNRLMRLGIFPDSSYYK